MERSRVRPIGGNFEDALDVATWSALAIVTVAPICAFAAVIERIGVVGVCTVTMVPLAFVVVAPDKAVALADKAISVATPFIRPVCIAFTVVAVLAVHTIRVVSAFVACIKFAIIAIKAVAAHPFTTSLNELLSVCANWSSSLLGHSIAENSARRPTTTGPLRTLKEDTKRIDLWLIPLEVPVEVADQVAPAAEVPTRIRNLPLAVTRNTRHALSLPAAAATQAINTVEGVTISTSLATLQSDYQRPATRRFDLGDTYTAQNSRPALADIDAVVPIAVDDDSSVPETFPTVDLATSLVHNSSPTLPALGGPIVTPGAISLYSALDNFATVTLKDNAPASPLADRTASIAPATHTKTSAVTTFAASTISTRLTPRPRPRPRLSHPAPSVASDAAYLTSDSPAVDALDISQNAVISDKQGPTDNGILRSEGIEVFGEANFEQQEAGNIPHAAAAPMKAAMDACAMGSIAQMDAAEAGEPIEEILKFSSPVATMTTSVTAVTALSLKTEAIFPDIAADNDDVAPVGFEAATIKKTAVSRSGQAANTSDEWTDTSDEGTDMSEEAMDMSDEEVEMRDVGTNTDFEDPEPVDLRREVDIARAMADVWRRRTAMAKGKAAEVRSLALKGTKEFFVTLAHSEAAKIRSETSAARVEVAVWKRRAAMAEVDAFKPLKMSSEHDKDGSKEVGSAKAKAVQTREEEAAELPGKSATAPVMGVKGEVVRTEEKACGPLAVATEVIGPSCRKAKDPRRKARMVTARRKALAARSQNAHSVAAKVVIASKNAGGASQK
ncbi:hypothetical protein HDU96_006233 [Phlyctochytrium bullatum]|nr:hypothetical protein HDU96_006233 [Phlyctochytrium bullatum]